jgi:hypothetical protein
MIIVNLTLEINQESFLDPLLYAKLRARHWRSEELDVSPGLK